MSINLNMRTSSVNMFRLFHVSFASSASNLIDTSVNYNTKVSLTEFSRPFCVSDSSLDDSANLFCNVNSNVIFSDEIFL